MSDFKFACPKCSQSIICDTSNAGMQIPCPVCQTPITVPKPQPAAPAVPVAGKLTINKTAHAHSAPPPGAANAPAKPAWGARAVAPPPAKKKFPIVPIAVVCGILVALAVGWFAFGAPYLKQQAEKKKQAEEEAARAAVEQARIAEEAAQAKRKPTWKSDLANVQFPNRPAVGKHHGTDFTVENAVYSSGSLVLVQTSGSPHQFLISVPLKSGETLSGKSFNVEATNTVNQPRVVLSWRDDPAKPPGTLTFAKGYSLKLEFGTTADGRLPGKVYLCLPDPDQSYVAGTFEIGPKNPAGQSPAAGSANPASRRRGGT
ncbi:MAG: hypothetical protein JWQ04_178 [Pedosphaera sp.]|nr:hypothetical protein [Pedosphaera sp.]